MSILVILILLALLWWLWQGHPVRYLIYPAPGISVGDPPSGMAELFLPVQGDTRVHGWLAHSSAGPSSSPMLLYFHGNGENLETMRLTGLCQLLKSLAGTVLMIDYPGYGRSTGKPSEENLIQAGEVAADYLLGRFPDRPLVIVGWSLGAAVAVQVAARRREQVRGVILMSPWSSLPEVAAEHYPAWLVRLVVKEKYDSVEAARQVDCPTLILHGGADAIIPPTQGRAVADALPRSEFREIPRRHHNDLLSEPEVWELIRRFLKNQGNIFDFS